MSARLTTSLELERSGRIEAPPPRVARARLRLEHGGLLLVAAAVSLACHVALALPVALTPTDIDLNPWALLPPSQAPHSEPVVMLVAALPPEPVEEEPELPPEPEPALEEEVAAVEPPQTEAAPLPEPEPEPEPEIDPESPRVARRPRVDPEPEPEPEPPPPVETAAAVVDDPAPTETPASAALGVPDAAAPESAPAVSPAAVSAAAAAGTPEPGAPRRAVEPAGHAAPAARATEAPERGTGGSGVDVDGARKAWLADVNAALHKDYPYPTSARRRGLEGQVKLKIWVETDGRIVKIAVHESSGHDVLDQAAVAAVEALGRVPSPPSAIGWSKRAMIVPFDYRLRS